MIFNFFKSKNNWQHKDSNIRISAINEELNIENDDDKTIIFSMLNNDTNELVRRAVLLKLNSFDAYYEASILNDNKSVQDFSTGQIQEILSGKHNISLSLDKKQAFLVQLTNNEKDKSSNLSLLKFWLEHEVDPVMVVKLFEVLVHKKNISQLLMQVFTKKQSGEVQKNLLSLQLDELNDIALLTKLNKKAVNDEVCQIIENRLSLITEELEKPKRLLKQNQLILSKLLALKDQSSYGQYITSKADLEQQWQSSIADISCLSEDEQNMLLSKYNKITTQLEQIFAPKAEAYHQAKIAEKLLKDKQNAQKGFNCVITSLNQQITTAVFEGENIESELINQNEFSKQLNQLREDITTSVLNAAEQKEFLQKTTQLEKRLTQLPEIAESVSEATYLISKISQLTLPQNLNELNDRQQTYYDWLASYKTINKKAQGVLPQSIIDAQKEISTMWKKGLQPLQQEQRQLFEQTKKKLHDLKRLLASGKYKVCFGLFKGVSQTITLLSVQQQQQLQRDFDNVSDKIAEISDWEHYIATPRKQELLKEVNTLANTPLDDPNAQADKVKYYRKVWNSLGHADETIDKDLNEQFNLACEQAFAPCRLFYAEQEKLRALHLVTRNNIVNDAMKLAESFTETHSNELNNLSIDYKALDGKLNKLQQRWQQAGEVDRHEYQKLLKAFKNAIQPIKKAIKAFHDANGMSKQALIVEAEQQLASDDIYKAIENIKQLQLQWRDIGFAGSHQESKLWQKFRSINDQVFAKRDLAKSEQQAELSQASENFLLSLAVIEASINDVSVTNHEKSSFIHAKEQANVLLNQVIANKPVIKSVASKVEGFIEQINQKIKQINAEQENKSWQSVFKLLDKIAQQNSEITADNIVNDPEYKNLTSFWQKRLVEQCSVTTQATISSRVEKTLALEILAQVPSPDEYAKQRMAVQVSLMQEQMQTSDAIDLEQGFIDWLSLGKLEITDVALLARLKRIYI